MQKKPARRAILLEDALLSLMEMEKTFAALASSDVFQTFSTKQKAAYRDTHSRLLDLIHDLEQDSAEEQLAS